MSYIVWRGVDATVRVFNFDFNIHFGNTDGQNGAACLFSSLSALVCAQSLHCFFLINFIPFFSPLSPIPIPFFFNQAGL